MADAAPDLRERLRQGEADPPARQRRATEDEPGDGEADRSGDRTDEERDPPLAHRPAREPPDREPGGNQDGADDERRHADLPTFRDLDECLRVESGGAEQLELLRAALRLHLPQPVEVPQLHRHVLAVRNYDIPRNKLDEVANRRPERSEVLVHMRSVVTVPPKALQRDEHTAVIRVGALGPRERRRPSELAEHLAVARTTDVDLVEERGDRLVVAAEQLETLKRAVVGIVEALGGRIAHRVARS